MALRASQFDIHRWLKYRELDDGRRILLPGSLTITAMQKACFRCWQTSPGSTRRRRSHQHSLFNPINKAATNGTSK
jgi:hypothetical protein